MHVPRVRRDARSLKSPRTAPVSPSSDGDAARLVPRSAVADLDWPAIPDADGARRLGICYQLEHTQFWPPRQLQAWQWRQLQRLLAHAYETVPHYRRRFDQRGLRLRDLRHRESWTRVPVLDRKTLQGAYATLRSSRVPRSHGAVQTVTTSGSTGRSVAVDRSAITQLYWSAFTLRDHHWHGRRFDRRLAVIRDAPLDKALPPAGTTARDWGAATAGLYETGGSALLNICRSSVDEQAEWLHRVQPHYLLTYPTAMKAIAEHCARERIPLASLAQLRAFGEVLDPACREVCREALGVEITDAYSSQEVGYIAIQCPVSERYHVMAEGALVEILDDAGEPVRAGEVGRVVVTPLHNFAMPLLRYEIGDYAEAGAPCPCGRGLPVLERILGRARNLLVYPDGRQFWPSFSDGEGLGDLPLQQRWQVVQRTPETLELRLLRERPLSDEETRAVTAYLQRIFDYPFAVRLVYVDDIPRSPTGKFEDFMSEVAVPPPARESARADHPS